MTSTPRHTVLRTTFVNTLSLPYIPGIPQEEVLTGIMWRAPSILRPRLTFTYIGTSLFVLYACYCFLMAQPLLSTNLPKHKGQYDVGVVDIEVPCEPRTFSDATLKETGKVAFELETVLFSIYYPADKGTTSTVQKHFWIPKPISLVGEGYARFVHFNNFVTNGAFTAGLWLLAGGTQIQAEVDVPIGGKSTKDAGQDEKFPVMVFSHGMASSRTDYTHYCGELASHGYVVAAVEHRDGSSPGTTVMRGDGTEKRVFHIGLHDVRHDPPMDIDAFKRAQLAMRQAEIEETVRVIQVINDGKGAEVLVLNSRKEGRKLNEWTGRLDLDRLVVGGHSYGATGALQTLKDAPSPKFPIKGAIILDPGKQSGPLNDDISVPILIINSNSWSSRFSVFFGRPHFDVVKHLVEKVLERGKAAWFMTSLGTSHPSCTDAPLVEPTLLAWTTGTTISALEGAEQYIRVSLEFLEFLKSGKVRGVLGEKALYPEYDKRVEGERKNEAVEKYWQVHVAPK